MSVIQARSERRDRILGGGVTGGSTGGSDAGYPDRRASALLVGIVTDITGGEPLTPNTRPTAGPAALWQTHPPALVHGRPNVHVDRRTRPGLGEEA